MGVNSEKRRIAVFIKKFAFVSRGRSSTSDRICGAVEGLGSAILRLLLRCEDFIARSM